MTHIPLLALDGISVSVGGTTILEDIAFEVADGEKLWVIGPNGAGKTTLFECIAGHRKHGSGTLSIQGRTGSSFSPRERATWIGYVPQIVGTIPGFTVVEFIRMSRYPHLARFSWLGEQDRRIVEQVMELTGIRSFATRRMDSLSGGERQKVLIAAALAQQPRVLLLDEPTIYLDPRHQLEVLAMLSRINSEQGIAILAVTHEVTLALASSDRILGLKRGRLVLDDKAERIRSTRALDGLYDVAFSYLSRPDGSGTWVVPAGLGT